MSNPRTTMRKIREVLRLRLAEGLSPRQISAALGVPRITVRRHLERAAEKGITWPLSGDMDDRALEAVLFARIDPTTSATRPLPDWSEINRELRRKGVTLQLLWQEYKEQHPDGFQYTWFAEHYRQYNRLLDLVMRHDHLAGEKLFVDFPGQTVPIYDRTTEAEVMRAEVFVAVLGASNYTYAEALPSQELPYWIKAHVNTFTHLGGCPSVLVPDNLKSAITKAHRYEPLVNESYLYMAAHFGAVVLPARPRRPRDKAKAEVGVQVVERWILARLRDQRFYSLVALNGEIQRLLVLLNARPFKKMPGSRQSWFVEIDRPALRPLPAMAYEFATFSKHIVHIDYHVQVDYHYYSVPYQLVGETVEVRLTVSTVEIFLRGRRITSHLRSFRRGKHTTKSEHMPKSHRNTKWPPHRLLNWAAKTGPSTAALCQGVMESRPHPEQGYRSCLGIMSLGRRYGPERLEAACRRALTVKALSFRSVDSILKNGLDKKPLADDAPVHRPRRLHENLRGPNHYK